MTFTLAETVGDVLAVALAPSSGETKSDEYLPLAS
jgi:hypothetical protein